MFNISELAESVGLSRSTPLYEEKLGLLKGRCRRNGYRVDSDADRQRLLLLQRLQAGGLSLREYQDCRDGKIDRDQLGRRLETLKAEIEAKYRSLDLLTALRLQDVSVGALLTLPALHGPSEWDSMCHVTHPTRNHGVFDRTQRTGSGDR